MDAGDVVSPVWPPPFSSLVSTPCVRVTNIWASSDTKSHHVVNPCGNFHKSTIRLMTASSTTDDDDCDDVAVVVAVVVAWNKGKGISTLTCHCPCRTRRAVVPSGGHIVADVSFFRVPVVVVVAAAGMIV